MLDFLFIVIIITILNYSGITIGYVIASNKQEDKPYTKIRNIFGHREELEEAYVPDED